MSHARPTAGVIALIALLALAGCAAPQGSPDRADPDEDVLGWENGYWHDDPIAVTNDDGLNESELEALVARTMARIERVRGLEFDSTVPVRIVNRSAVLDGQEASTPGERLLSNASAEAVFLAGEDTDATGAFEGLIRNGSGGVYDPQTDRIRIVTDRDRPILSGETVLAHELTHALQDQHFGIDLGNRTTSDGQLAYRGLVEGDATLLESRYRTRCGETWSCVQGPQPTLTPQQQSLARLGLYWQLLFSYADGVDYAAHHYAAGGWPAVNEQFETAPSTTSEILHPDRPAPAETSISVPDRSGEGWTPATVDGAPATDRLGEGTLSTSFVFTAFDAYNGSTLVDPLTVINREGLSVNQTDPLDYGLPVTDGWAGDRLQVYSNGSATGYVFRSAWRSPAEAREFAEGYRALLSHWGGQPVGDGHWLIPDGPYADAFRLTVEGDTVTVVNAPTLEALSAVHARGA